MPLLTFIYLAARRLLLIFRGKCDKAMPWAIASRLLGEKPAVVPVHRVTGHDGGGVEHSGHRPLRTFWEGFDRLLPTTSLYTMHPRGH